VHIHPHETERPSDLSNRHDPFDRKATVLIDAVVIGALAIYFMASAFSLFFD
jgi:hypothetical protein